MRIYDKECEYCGSLYETSHKHQLTCSQLCGQRRAHRAIGHVGLNNEARAMEHSRQIRELWRAPAKTA